MKVKYTVLLALFLMVNCSQEPVINADIKKYNIFSVLRTDKDTQKVIITKILKLNQTKGFVDVNAWVYSSKDTFKLERINSEEFIGLFSPIDGRKYTLKITGENRDLNVSCKIPDKYEVLSPQENDTVLNSLLIEIKPGMDNYIYFIYINETLKGSFFKYEYPETDTILFTISLDNVKTDTFFNLSIFALDSAGFFAYSNINDDLEDTLPDYYGKFYGFNVKNTKIFKKRR